VSPTTLANLRAQRAVLLRQLQLVETMIAAETGMCAFTAIDDRLAESLDAACLANGVCGIPVADLRALPAAPEPLPGAN
jgi:hypothetical protein